MASICMCGVLEGFYSQCLYVLSMGCVAGLYSQYVCELCDGKLYSQHLYVLYICCVAGLYGQCVYVLCIGGLL